VLLHHQLHKLPDLQLFTSSLFLQVSVEKHEEVLHLVGKVSLLFRVLDGFNQLVDLISHLLGRDTGTGTSEVLSNERLPYQLIDDTPLLPVDIP
jgi:hypothetical protein